MSGDVQTVDSDGKPAPFQAGDKVVYGPLNKIVTVEKQYLHNDCGEWYWGNVTCTHDGERFHVNQWQLRKVQP